MKELRKEIEDRLGFEVGDMQLKKSMCHAEKKLYSMILRYGDAGGRRREPDYLAQLVYEDIRADVFSEAALLKAVNTHNMEKERSAKNRNAQMDNLIVNVSAVEIKQNLQYGGKFL